MKKLGAVIPVVAVVAVIAIVRTMVMNAALESMNNPVVNMEFTEDGMSITLTNEFARQEVGSAEDYTSDTAISMVAAYASDTAVVVVTKESFSGLQEKGHDPAAFTAKDYTQVLIESNERGGSEMMEENGIPYYTYEETYSSGEIWTHQMCVMKGTEDFWRFAFACPAEDFSDQQPDFFKWMGTVQLS